MFKLFHVLGRIFPFTSLMMKKLPVIVILGSTGTGKSKLALELARKFGGEIISADSMQVYKGLDIITNKVTPEEQEIAPHHMLDFLLPSQMFTVVDFQSRSLQIIDEIIARCCLPIVVGGTYYYVESLLWKTLVHTVNNSSESLLFEKEKAVLDRVKRQTTELSTVNKKCETQEEQMGEESTFFSVYQDDLHLVSNESLHNKLKEIDPLKADQLHPNDRRKVIRALQVYEQTGRVLSDYIQEQKSVVGGSSLGGPLRFPNSCILWLQCEQKVLDKRLDARVEEMMKRGLIDELTNFHREWNNKRILENIENEASYSQGLFQSIGFKEFHDYLILSEEERRSANGEKLFNLGVEKLKIATRQYSRKQQKWIKNRLLRKPDRPIPPMYCFDVTDLSSWKDSVLQPSITIVDALVKGEVPPVDPVLKEPSIQYERKTFKCEICDRIFVGGNTWEAHMASKKHKKMVAYKKKAAICKES